MEKYDFENEHLSEKDMMRYIALNDLTGDNRLFAKAVQKHLCICKECAARLTLCEELCEKATAAASLRSKESFDISQDTARLSEKAAFFAISKLLENESENETEIKRSFFEN